MAIWNERIKEKRTEKGITLAQIAEALNVTEATAQRYESGGIKNVPYDHICTYAKLLNCSPSYLMGWEEETPQAQTIAAHFDGDSFTEDELDEIQHYIDFVKSRRNK